MHILRSKAVAADSNFIGYQTMKKNIMTETEQESAQENNFSRRKIILEELDRERKTAAPHSKPHRSEELQMEVEKVYPSDDYGKGIIQLPSEIMEALDISAGEPVEIEGERKTVARVWKANILEGLTEDTVRMDTFIRYNAKVTVGDKVTLRKAKVIPAKKITVAPLEEEKLTLTGEIEDKIRYNLRERYLVKEDIIPVRKDLLGFNDVARPEVKKQTVEFMVTQVTPSKSTVMITDETQISFEKSVEGYRKKHVSL
jgi:Cell division protein 48 (CDC48), domain 2./Cell division protein 48 (CDC48), N-terminal domain.